MKSEVLSDGPKIKLFLIYFKSIYLINPTNFIVSHEDNFTTIMAFVSSYCHFLTYF